MRHTESRTLFAYWDGLRAGRAAPDRTEVEPRAIAPILGDTFIIEGDRTGALTYRLAGSRVCSAFGREMKGASFLGSFASNDRQTVARAVADSHAAQAGLFLSLTGATEEGRSVPLEAVILPLVHRGRLGARMIGCISAEEAPYWMGRDGIATLSVASVRLLWPSWQPEEAAASPAPMTVVLGARPPLRVIQGGNAA